MNTTIIGLGALATLILIFLIAKSQRRHTHQEIDWDSHNLQITAENENLRILAGGHSYLMRIKREDFLEQYREAWNQVHLNYDHLVIYGETIEFTPSEQLSLKQRIVLNWLYVYNINNRRFKFLFWSMGDTQTYRDVLEATGIKYGSKSERAMALAAHVLNINLRKFSSWMESYEEFINQR